MHCQTKRQKNRKKIEHVKHLSGDGCVDFRPEVYDRADVLVPKLGHPNCLGRPQHAGITLDAKGVNHLFFCVVDEEVVDVSCTQWWWWWQW